jgi:hypothetical protein
VTGVRPSWAVLAFPLAAFLLCAEAFRPGHVFLPTALESLAPWSERAGPLRPRSNPLASDSLLLTLPARAYNHEMLREGRLPFWNPRVFCGYPHLALIQNGALYPLTLPFDLVDPLAGIGYATWLHLTLAGLLMYAFLRRTGLGVPAALVGGLAFELNGFFLVRLSVPSYLHSGTWLPLMLLGARALADRAGGRARWALPVGVALSVLGGHPQITVLAVTLTLAYGAWHVLAARPGAAKAAWPLAALCLLTVLGVALAGGAVVPFAELLAHSARDAVPLGVYRRSAAPLVALAQAMVPDAFGHPVDGTYWLDRAASAFDGVPAEARYWGFNYIGQNLFTGVAPVALALLALLRAPARREVALFGLAAGAALAIFFGTPLLAAAWGVLPGFRYSRPDRIVFVYMAAIAVLAAHGVEAVPESRARSPRWRFALVLAVAGAMAWMAWAPLFVLDRRAALAGAVAGAADGFRARPGPLVGQAAIAVLALAFVWLLARRRWTGRWVIATLAALVVVPNLVFGWRFNPAQPRPRLGTTAVERALPSRPDGGRLARVLAGDPLFLPPNLAQMLGLADTQGASAAGLEAYVRLVEAIDPAAIVGGKYFLAFRDPRVAATPLLRLLSVEWVAADRPVPLPQAPVTSGAVALFRNPDFRPRFYVVPRAEPFDDVARARERLLSPSFDPQVSVLVPAAQATAFRPAPDVAPAPAAPVAVVRYEPHAVELDVQSAGGVLVSSEAFYPGWDSFVDGEPAETLRVNTAFRGVAVPAGRHRVTMKYVPRSFVAGLVLSGVALGVTLLALLRRW